MDKERLDLNLRRIVSSFLSAAGGALAPCPTLKNLIYHLISGSNAHWKGK